MIGTHVGHGIYSLSSSTITLSSIDDAKKYTIGVQSEDAGAKALEKLGFDKLDQALSVDKSVKKLQSGRIDMVAMAESMMNDLNKNGADLKVLHTILEIEMGLACNVAMDAGLIKKMQDALTQHCQ